MPKARMEEGSVVELDGCFEGRTAMEGRRGESEYRQVTKEKPLELTRHDDSEKRCKVEGGCGRRRGREGDLKVG